MLQRRLCPQTTRNGVSHQGVLSAMGLRLVTHVVIMAFPLPIRNLTRLLSPIIHADCHTFSRDDDLAAWVVLSQCYLIDFAQ